MDDAAKPSDWSEQWLMEHANREYCDRKMRTRDIVGTTIDPSMDFSKMRRAKLKAEVSRQQRVVPTVRGERRFRKGAEGVCSVGRCEAR